MLKRWMVVCSLVLSMVTSLCAGVFEQVPENHWAWGAVKSLMEHGIIEQNSFKNFEGDRSLNRYEFAITFSRYLAFIEQKMVDGRLTVSRQDFYTINRLTDEFSSELSLLGIRIESVEQSLETVQEDLTDLKVDVKKIDRDFANQKEKVRLSGNWLVRSTWKTHDNDWATNPYSGAAQAGNSNNYAMETQARFRFDAQIDDDVSMGARFRLLWKNGDTVTGGYPRNSTYGLTGTGGNIVGDMAFDTAFFGIKRLLNDKDELTLGRKFNVNGHGMMLFAFIDEIKYNRQLSNDLTLSAIYYPDRHVGNYIDNGATDMRGIWNLNAEKKLHNKTFYLSFYAQDEPNLMNDLMPGSINLGNALAGNQKRDSRRDFEFGSMGKIWKNDVLTYDLSFVYSDYKAKMVSTAAVPAIDVNRDGWQGLGAVSWKPNSEFKAKLQYVFGDDENSGCYAIVNDARYIYADETPYEDVSRGNAWFNRGLINMSDLKFQVEFTPKNAKKHYFRVAADWLRELNDISRNDFTHYLAGNINGITPAGIDLRNTRYDTFNNLGIADPSARMLTLEYRYQLARNVKIRINYVTFDLSGDAQKATATQTRIKAGRGWKNDFNYDMFWSEIYSTF